MYWVIPIVTVPKAIPFVRIDPSEMSVNVAYQYGFLRCLLGFVWGMIAYRAYTANQGRALLGNGWMLLLLTVGLTLCLHFSIPDAVSVAFLPFILLSAAFGSSRANRFFNWRPLQKLGDWSFSIYMVHQPLILIFFSLLLTVAPPAAAVGGPATQARHGRRLDDVYIGSSAYAGRFHIDISFLGGAYAQTGKQISSRFGSSAINRQ
jgi:peptidoglycan/LPS O-acetylase OafA/YrhL